MRLVAASGLWALPAPVTVSAPRLAMCAPDMPAMSYRELQQACKAAGMPATGKTETLRARLLELAQDGGRAATLPSPPLPAAAATSVGEQSRRVPAFTAAGAADEEQLLALCLEQDPIAGLDQLARERVGGYVRELLQYNRHTNVYSQSAYSHLPFHVADSVTLGLLISALATSASQVLDLGSGSGLPSVLIACVNPDIPVYALESKSRKTRFLTQAGRALSLPLYRPITANVHEFSRVTYCDADFVTAKAFKPLPEVAPIAAACISASALLHVPVSEAQIREMSIPETKLLRQGQFVYYRQRVKAERGTAKRQPIALTR
jgi:16S rRNA G527 N7-methylase RsmG